MTSRPIFALHARHNILRIHLKQLRGADLARSKMNQLQKFQYTPNALLQALILQECSHSLVHSATLRPSPAPLYAIHMLRSDTQHSRR